MKAVLVVLVVISSPAVACAQGSKDRLCGTWAINAWGLSYHITEDADYNDANLGVGVRCYARPERPRVVANADAAIRVDRSEEHTSELQSRFDIVCRLLLV